MDALFHLLESSVGTCELSGSAQAASNRFCLLRISYSRSPSTTQGDRPRTPLPEEIVILGAEFNQSRIVSQYVPLRFVTRISHEKRAHLRISPALGVLAPSYPLP
jgi:hypothetical protein